MTKPRIAVCAALLVRDGCVFAARRAASQSQAGLWEFPGGKIERGESAPQSLARELREELDIVADIGAYFATNEHEYDDKIIELSAYWVDQFTGDIALSVHDAHRWLAPDQLTSLAWAPADVPFLAPLAEALVNLAENP